MTPATGRNPNRLLFVAIAIYCGLAFALVARRPGLQYDEALHVLGSVHMRHSVQELPLPHDPNTWICPLGRCIPLMTLRYTGALKEYLCLPLLYAFGPKTSIVRFVSILLAAFGLFGIGTFLSEQFHPTAGAAVALILAVNPSFVNMTVFDNSAIAAWMGALGLAAWALSRYLSHPSFTDAFIFGATAGFGVWVRANFLWVIAAMLVAALIVFRTPVVRPGHLAAAFIGSLIGALPFLVYQFTSEGGTWQALSMFESKQSISSRLYSRLILFAESLLSDREHRAMWGTIEMASWQRWLFPVVVWVSILICLFAARRSNSPYLVRVVAITFVLLFTILFSSSLEISEHHLIVLLPFAATVVVLALMVAMRSSWMTKVVSVAVATLYGGLAMHWHALALRGLSQTGGLATWSSGINTVAAKLMSLERSREITVLDWGLQNSLYVISDSKLKTREAFWDFPSDPKLQQTYWYERLPHGGVFLLYAAGHRQMPAMSDSFLRTLHTSGVRFDRVTVPQKDGASYAEIYSVAPGGAPLSHQPAPLTSSRMLKMNDPGVSDRLQGFHEVEESGWRWTRRTFSIVFPLSDGRQTHGAALSLNLYVPEAVIARFGSVTLSAAINGHTLGDAVFRSGGVATYKRSINATLLRKTQEKITFSLDNSLPPTAADARELGIIVSSAVMEEVPRE